MGKRVGDSTINRADVLRKDATETLNLILAVTHIRASATAAADTTRQDKAA